MRALTMFLFLVVFLFVAASYATKLQESDGNDHRDWQAEEAARNAAHVRETTPSAMTAVLQNKLARVRSGLMQVTTNRMAGKEIDSQAVRLLLSEESTLETLLESRRLQGLR